VFVSVRLTRVSSCGSLFAVGRCGVFLVLFAVVCGDVFWRLVKDSFGSTAISSFNLCSSSGDNLLLTITLFWSSSLCSVRCVRCGYFSVNSVCSANR